MAWSFEACLMLAVGSICMGLWRSLGRLAYDYQRRHFGVRSSERVYQAAYFIAGILFTVLGVLTVFGIVHFGS